MREHEMSRDLEEVKPEVLARLGVKLRVNSDVVFHGYNADVISITTRESNPKIEDLFVSLGLEITTASIPITSLDKKYYL